MEQDALIQIDEIQIAAEEGTEPETKTPYKWFMKTEPPQREEEGEIFTDPDNGMRYEIRKVGMVRNAKNPKTLKVFLDPAPHILIPGDSKPLQGWYKSKHVPSNQRPRPCFTEAVLTEPYGGTCPVRCTFCYINSGTRGYRAQSLTTVPENYGQHIHNHLSKMKTSAACYISSFTEPFQELEDLYHNSQGCAEAFADHGLPVFFLSRLDYPGWAYDVLKRNKYSYAQKSINTSNPETWRKISPNAPPLHEQIETVRSLHKAGIYVSIQVNPIMPGVTSNDDIVQLIHMLGEAGADHLIFKFTEIGYSSKRALLDITIRQFGNAGREYEKLLTCNIGGQCTIDESYRIAAFDTFSKECKKAKVTMSLCYEYKYARDKDGNILSKSGVSMGRDYITSDQCHGHRVPMYHRDSLALPFQEMEECPPTGCLHCADDNAGVARCGDEDLGQAKARTFVDMKKGLVHISV